MAIFKTQLYGAIIKTNPYAADADRHAEPAKRVFLKNCRYFSIVGPCGKSRGVKIISAILVRFF